MKAHTQIQRYMVNASRYLSSLLLIAATFLSQSASGMFTVRADPGYTGIIVTNTSSNAYTHSITLRCANGSYCYASEIPGPLGMNGYGNASGLDASGGGYD